MNGPEDAQDYLWLTQDLWMENEVWAWANKNPDAKGKVLKTCSLGTCGKSEVRVAVDRAWRNSGGELLVSIYINVTLLIRTFKGNCYKALRGSSALLGRRTHNVHCHYDFTAQRNHQKVNVVIALTQARAFYYVHKSQGYAPFL